MYAIVTIGPDGTLAVAGPYSSGVYAGQVAGRLKDAFPGLNAEVHQMTSPRDLHREIKEVLG